MSLRLLVVCDSDPAPYAGGTSWPCRAYLPVATADPLAALDEAARAGWNVTVSVVPPTGVTATCPACTRATHARAAERPQEAAP